MATEDFMNRMMERSYVVLLTLLVGGQAAVGYLVAPTLFEVIVNRSDAGTIAGAIFERMGWVSLVGYIMLLGLRWSMNRSGLVDSKWPLRVIVITLGITALGHFLIRPWIATVRATIQQAGGFEMCDPALRGQFGMLHGASSLLFLAAFILGLSLVIRLGEPPRV